MVFVIIVFVFIDEVVWFRLVKIEGSVFVCEFSSGFIGVVVIVSIFCYLKYWVLVWLVDKYCIIFDYEYDVIIKIYVLNRVE